MTTKCIELEYPFDGRRKATIVTNNKQVCKYLAENPDGKIGITIGEKNDWWNYKMVRNNYFGTRNSFFVVSSVDNI